MTEKIRRMMNDPRLVENRIKWFERLRNVFDGPYERHFVLSGCIGRHKGSLGCPDLDDIYHNDPEQAIEIGLEDLAKQMEAAGDRMERMFIPFALEADWYGVHFVDKIFGADVFYNTEVRQWYNRYLKTPIGELVRPDLENNETWRQARAYAEAFLALDLSVPLLGTPVLSSPLNIAINLYGPEFLVAMIGEPEAARHDLAVINDLIIDLHRWYLAHVPLDRLQPTVVPWRTQPAGFGQLCGCSTHLISPMMYEEMIMPLDDQLLAQWPHGGMIHLCGSHRHLIPLFASMPHLRSVQLNDLASDQLEEYVKGLREDQVIYFSPSQNMSFEESLKVSRGKRMVYVGNFEEIAWREG